MGSPYKEGTVVPAPDGNTTFSVEKSQFDDSYQLFYGRGEFHGYNLCRLSEIDPKCIPPLQDQIVEAMNGYYDLKMRYDALASAVRESLLDSLKEGFDQDSRDIFIHLIRTVQTQGIITKSEMKALLGE